MLVSMVPHPDGSSTPFSLGEIRRCHKVTKIKVISLRIDGLSIPKGRLVKVLINQNVGTVPSIVQLL